MKNSAYFLIIFGLTSLVLAQNNPQITTLEEYDALPHDQQIKIYRDLPKEVRDKLIVRENVAMEKLKKQIEEEKNKRINVLRSGCYPMTEALLFEKTMGELVIKSQYPDPADEQRIQRLKAGKERYDLEMELLGKTEHAPKVEVWDKHKARFEELQKQYPLEKPSDKAVEAIEKEVKSLLADVEKLPRVKE